MNRSLIPAKPVKPPKELEAFFDNPPLVGNERREDYDAFFSAIAKAETPSDAIDWILLQELVDRSWEIRRERRIKPQIVKIHQKEVVADLLKATFDKTDRVGSALNRILNAPAEAELWASDPDARKSIDLKLAEKGHPPDAVLAQAYMRGAADIEAIDKRIASYECQRNAILREIGLRSQRMARKLDKASSDVIDGEFTEAAE